MKRKTRREDFMKKHPKALALPHDGETPRCCCRLAGYTTHCLAHSEDDFPECCVKCWDRPVKEEWLMNQLSKFKSPMWRKSMLCRLSLSDITNDLEEVSESGDYYS